MVDKKGGITIPRPFLKALNISGGDQVIVCIENDELRITTLKSPIARAQRRVRQYVETGASLVDELITERRAEAERE